MKYTYELKQNHISQENSQNILPLKCLVQDLCLSYRNKVWDGKIRLFSVATGQIYLGLLPYIREFCKRNDIRYELDFNTRPEDIDESTIKSFIKHLKIPYKARDYQISSILSGVRNVVVFCLSYHLCKSLIIYGLTRWCLKES